VHTSGHHLSTFCQRDENVFKERENKQKNVAYGNIFDKRDSWFSCATGVNVNQFRHPATYCYCCCRLRACEGTP